MQAYSPALPVGAQHYYKNSFHALSTIFRAEGPRGLIRGIDAAILRTSMGSSVHSFLDVDQQLDSLRIGATTELQPHQKLLGEPRDTPGQQHVDVSREQRRFWGVRCTSFGFSHLTAIVHSL
jgi:hypothetical protein